MGTASSFLHSKPFLKPSSTTTGLFKIKKKDDTNDKPVSNPIPLLPATGVINHDLENYDQYLDEQFNETALDDAILNTEPSQPAPTESSNEPMIEIATPKAKKAMNEAQMASGTMKSKFSQFQFNLNFNPESYKLKDKEATPTNSKRSSLHEDATALSPFTQKSASPPKRLRFISEVKENDSCYSILLDAAQHVNKIEQIQKRKISELESSLQEKGNVIQDLVAQQKSQDDKLVELQRQVRQFTDISSQLDNRIESLIRCNHEYKVSEFTN